MRATRCGRSWGTSGRWARRTCPWRSSWAPGSAWTCRWRGPRSAGSPPGWVFQGPACRTQGSRPGDRRPAPARAGQDERGLRLGRAGRARRLLRHHRGPSVRRDLEPARPVHAGPSAAAARPADRPGPAERRRHPDRRRAAHRRAEPGRSARDRDLPDPLRGLAGRRPAQHAGREAHRRARQGATARAATRRLKEQPIRHGVVLFSSDRVITPAHAAAAAEAAGFACFYVPEHTHIPVRRDAAHPGTGTAELPADRYLRTLDPWVALSMAAAVTHAIRLGTAVALPAEHDPITLAKTIASLDHLSGGRVELGGGFGWNTDELSDHGVPPGQRRTVLREHVEAMQALWSQDEASYHGQFADFGPSWAWPKPFQPRIPLLVGAGGTERTFGWIARSADGWIT